MRVVSKIEEGQIIYVAEISSSIEDEFVLGNLRNVHTNGTIVKRGFGIFISYIDPETVGCMPDYPPKICAVMMGNVVGWCFETDFIVVDI